MCKETPRHGHMAPQEPCFHDMVDRGQLVPLAEWFRGLRQVSLVLDSNSYVFQRRKYSYNTTTTGIAFFYFTFNDESKKDVSAMLHTLLLQLSNQHREGPKYLSRLHESYKSGIPPTRMLIEHFRSLIQKFEHVYIMLDALDESPRYDSRDAVLDACHTMRSWSLQSLHLPVTSRDELDIRESLKPSPDQEIWIKNDGVDEDIARFISGRLDSDPKLKSGGHTVSKSKKHCRRELRECKYKFKLIENRNGTIYHFTDCFYPVSGGLNANSSPCSRVLGAKSIWTGSSSRCLNLSMKHTSGCYALSTII